MGTSKIEWTDVTWNPISGCTKVSEGCRNCYAERMAKRLAGRYGYPADEPFRVTLHPDRLEQPLRWKKPRMVFVPSMGDLFHEDVPPEFIGRVLNVIGNAKQHTFQLLTKRARRMLAVMSAYYDTLGLAPFKNLWLGVSAENQETADERIPFLFQTPAALRFVSCEPLLGPVDLWHSLVSHSPRDEWDPNSYTRISRLQWVIVGGESGPGARPMHPDWARDIRDQCQEAEVPLFFKQWGAWIPADQMNAEGQAAAKRNGYSLIPEIVRWQEFYDKLPDKSKRVHIWPDGSKSFNIGKKTAGRLLDGREWNEMPGGK